MNVLEIPDIDLKKELKKCSSMEDLVVKNGLMQRLFGDIIQQFLEAEMEEYLGREKYARLPDEDKDYRNGYSSKNIRSSFGPVKVDVPRDRKAELQLLKYEKYGILILEKKGKILGAELLNRHNIIENFLRILDVSESNVLEETEKIEHTVSKQTTKCFQDFLKFIKDNPEVINSFKAYKSAFK